MSLTILPLAFIDSSIDTDEPTFPVEIPFLEITLVDSTSLIDPEAFAVRFLSSSKDLANVLTVKAIDLNVWDGEPLEVFRLEDLRSLFVVKDAIFANSLSCFLAVIRMDWVFGVFACLKLLLGFRLLLVFHLSLIFFLLMLANFFIVLVVLFSNSAIRCGDGPLSLLVAKASHLSHFFCSISSGDGPLSLPGTFDKLALVLRAT